MRTTSPIAALAALTCLMPALAWAQDPPAGTGTGVDQATSGNAEIDGQGKFTAAEAPDEESNDATELSISTGGILSTGNSNQAAITGSLNTRVRRSDHQFSSIVLGNYAAAKTEDGGKFEKTVGNIQGRVRYDYFFAERWSVFGMVTARHDRFQQLDLRLNVDPGVAFYALTK